MGFIIKLIRREQNKPCEPKIQKGENDEEREREREARSEREQSSVFDSHIFLSDPSSSSSTFLPSSSSSSAHRPALPSPGNRNTAQAATHTTRESMTTEAVKDVAKAAAETNGSVAAPIENKKKSSSPSGDGAPAAPSSKKSVPKPDEAAMKAACDELAAKIEKNKQRLETIRSILADRAQKKKEGGSPAMQALREKLAGLREQFKSELVCGGSEREIEGRAACVWRGKGIGRFLCV